MSAGSWAIKQLESDDSLRERILYVSSTVNQPGDRRVVSACGALLDELAEQYGLQRRLQ